MNFPLHLKQKIKAVENAQKALEQGIFDAIDHEAARLELDEVIFTGFSNGATKDGEELETFPPTLEALDDLYLEHINEGGFQALWTKEEGWC